MQKALPASCLQKPIHFNIIACRDNHAGGNISMVFFDLNIFSRFIVVQLDCITFLTNAARNKEFFIFALQLTPEFSYNYAAKWIRAV